MEKEIINKENSVNKTTCLKHTMYPFQINNLEDNTDHFDLENKISWTATCRSSALTVTLPTLTGSVTQSTRADYWQQAMQQWVNEGNEVIKTNVQNTWLNIEKVPSCK